MRLSDFTYKRNKAALLGLVLLCLLASGFAAPAVADTIWEEDFESYVVGTTSSTDKWETQWNGTADVDTYFSVQDVSGNKLFVGCDLDEEAVWTSTAIDISAYSNDVTISLNISEVGSMTAANWIKGYYRLDGGAETLFFEDIDDLAGGSTLVERSTAGLSGSSLVLVVKSTNNTTSKQWRFDDILITGTLGGADTIAPSAVSNLSALTGSNQGTVELKWTAPGDDGSGGGDAFSYTLKFATYQISVADFELVDEYTPASSWTPATAGTEENRVVSGLRFGTTYYFAIKAQDSSTNEASWSSGPYASESNKAYAGPHPENALLDEDFEGSFPPLGWTNTNTDQYTTNHTDGGSYGVRFNNSAERIATPVLSSPGTLEFYINSTANPADFTVETASSPYGDWAVLDTITDDLGGIWNLKQYDLSGSSNIYVSFRRSGGLNTYNIDDVFVSSAPAPVPPGTSTPTWTVIEGFDNDSNQSDQAYIPDAGWWTASPSNFGYLVVSTMSFNGSSCLEVNYDNDGNWPSLNAADLFSGGNNVSDFSLSVSSSISIRVRPVSKDVDILMKLRGADGGADVTGDMQTLNAGTTDQWQLLTWTWDGVTMNDCDPARVEEIQLIFAPGQTESGKVYIDDISLDDVGQNVPNVYPSASGSAAEITVYWPSATDADGDLASYSLYRATYDFSSADDSNVTSVISTTSLSYTDTGLDAAATYFYSLIAVDDASLKSVKTLNMSTCTVTLQPSLSISKSTSSASRKPGEELTYTITYSNSGEGNALNLYITDTVPLNSYISEAAASGSGDSVEYFVGSSWTSGYDAEATRIRWKDANVPASSGDLTVTYKVIIR